MEIGTVFCKRMLALAIAVKISPETGVHIACFCKTINEEPNLTCHS